MLALENWTLGAEPAAPEPAPVEPTAPFTFPQGQTRVVPQILAPAIPDSVPMRCQYDPAVAAWRCSYGSFWERPSTYVVAGSILGTLVLGLVIGSSNAFRGALGLLRKTVT